MMVTQTKMKNSSKCSSTCLFRVSPTVIIFIGFCVMYQSVSCDIFSSTSQLQNLMYLERHLITRMNDYVSSLEQRIQHIRGFIDDFTKSAGRPEFRDSMATDKDIVGNPLQAFQLIKRLTVNWNSMKSFMSEDSWQNVEEMVKEYEAVMPKEEDLHGAALALIRLQDTYNLNMTEMARGKILGNPAFVEMTARDCLYLGKHAFNNGYYGQAIEWFEEAQIKAHQEGNTTAPVDEIVPFYNMAVTIHDDLRPEYEKNLTGTAPHPAKMRFLDGDNDDYRNYQALCRGDNLRSPKNETKLKCYYSNRGNAWLTLQPVKVEEFHHYPIYIVMFHDLMTDSESDRIRAMAAPLLQRAKVQSDTDVTNGVQKVEVSKTRTSHTAWFSSDSNELVDRIAKRIEAVTGLSMDMTRSHSELMQVANYGMGGHYTPHYDYLIVDRPPEERNTAHVEDRDIFAGDRTATLMFYLLDVTSGGATVFPRLGVKLTPRKNSAAFWYNLYRNGEAIEDTVHGACPVLMGEKWVANHWIRENGQIFKRGCSLDPKE